ncbi:hypothetical protein NP493_639g00002 [Ridgeia piscesae]|uniref:G-protein coupled receptors family 1 profile domain-containing protein n=1 Tax=Ridgeia piscesae TaxID=27915 RepID=A0AAD9NNF2_RIDPI|nr:hypothetical protein NP493_639g00002 [Ridgeia piscesae]
MTELVSETAAVLTELVNETAAASQWSRNSSPAWDDLSQVPYPGLRVSLPWWEVCLNINIYSSIINVYVCLVCRYVVWRNKKLQTPTNFYIVNLAVSDLMVTCFCSWVHLVDSLSEGWVLGAFFCKFNSFSQVLALVSTILTLTLIACDRFFGVVFAMKARLTVRRANVYITCIWICSLVISSPLLVFRQQITRDWLDHREIWCADTWPVVVTRDPVTHALSVTRPSCTAYYTFVSVVLYFLPVVVMTGAYSIIVFKMKYTRIPGEHVAADARTQDTIKKKKIVVMLVTILSTFTVCWLPYQVAILYTTHRPNINTKLPVWYQHYQFFAVVMAHANSAVNPIIYTGFSDNFKKGARAILGFDKIQTYNGTLQKPTRLDGSNLQISFR